MILAVTAMSPTVRFIFLLLAVICFAIAAFVTPRTKYPISWVALGLTFFAIPPMWDALVQA
jgi:hypothetical protein